VSLVRITNRRQPNSLSTALNCNFVQAGVGGGVVELKLGDTSINCRGKEAVYLK
jgi:hypothetical protein